MQFKYPNTNRNDVLYYNFHVDKPTDDQYAFNSLRSRDKDTLIAYPTRETELFQRQPLQDTISMS